jgi:hypothetical protein
MLDLAGKTFGRLTVLHKTDERRHGQVMWACKCVCGVVKPVKSWYLTTGRVRSCGCLRSDILRQTKPGTVHGKHHDPAHRMWIRAKQRAAARGLDFNIEPLDVIIPSVCPVLGIPLGRGVDKPRYNSPALDRIDSSKGYVKGNIMVISHRANNLKNDATLDELKALVVYLETTRKEK